MSKVSEVIQGVFVEDIKSNPSLPYFESHQGLQRILEQAPLTIVVTNPKGEIEYVNPFFTRLTGYSLQEVLGLDTSILNSGYHPKSFFQDLWDQISAGHSWYGEFRNKKKNGELYWESASISSIKDSQGQIVHFVGIKEDITQKKAGEEAILKLQGEILALSLVDHLTGLDNRRGMEAKVGAVLKVARRAKQKSALLFIDLDNMKAINDTMGHQAGDAALVAMAGLLKATVRDSDVIARLGGDEFVVFLPGIEVVFIEDVLSRLRVNIEGYNQTVARELALYWSKGLAYDSGDSRLTLQEMINKADRNMYQDKSARKKT